MTKAQRVARKRSRDEIEEIAWNARHACGLGPFDRVPIARVLEHVIPELIEGFEFRVVEPGTLGGAEAITNAAEPIITFDDNVYDACAATARAIA